MSVSTDGETIHIDFPEESHELSRADAAALQEAIGDALTQKREFFRTAGEYREDGSYVVSRRSADSAGNRKVFDRFEAMERLYDRLPEEFTAEDVGRTGITGSRRHMLARHFVEHPGFDADIVSRNPLTVEKSAASTADETGGVDDTERDRRAEVVAD